MIASSSLTLFTLLEAVESPESKEMTSTFKAEVSISSMIHNRMALMNNQIKMQSFKSLRQLHQARRSWNVFIRQSRRSKEEHIRIASSIS
jgi:hypothetical protein